MFVQFSLTLAVSIRSLAFEHLRSYLHQNQHHIALSPHLPSAALVRHIFQGHHCGHCLLGYIFSLRHCLPVRYKAVGILDECQVISTVLCRSKQSRRWLDDCRRTDRSTGPPSSSTHDLEIGSHPNRTYWFGRYFLPRFPGYRRRHRTRCTNRRNIIQWVFLLQWAPFPLLTRCKIPTLVHATLLKLTQPSWFGVLSRSVLLYLQPA